MKRSRSDGSRPTAPPESSKTIRQEMIEALSMEEHTARDLSQVIGIRQKAVYGHLEHIARTLEPQGKRLTVIPSRCLDCGYVFKERKRLTPPSRCPRCKGQHLEEPRYRIE